MILHPTVKAAATLAVLALATGLFWRFPGTRLEANAPPAAPLDNPAVSLAGPGVVAVQPGSLLEKKLEIAQVRQERLTTPLLSVSGAVMARLRAGAGPMEDRWQFSGIELSGIYADWQKTGTEMEFAAKQLSKTRELTAAQYHSQARVVDRLRKLVATGTEAVRDLTSAEANLLQMQLEGEKAVFDAESALTQATHAHADLERRLLQAGVDPDLLEKEPAGASLVMADVPEVRISQVAVGQACEARFYGLPGQVFRGVVRSLAPALSPERRTLRVFFALMDAEGKLKPGMYAEIGLGTDPRLAVLAPADGVLHIGDADYVLKAENPGLWRVNPIQVGERAGDYVEILGGLKGGETIVGSGAILLKPLVVQSLLAGLRAADHGAVEPR
ncbi:Barrel-sandwich domain of CusB or HlyD membrane-fusion [Methylomagnum ishizawai]|uniref:Barrel-sandwich domain of CusB or HlyD membrane-fusion n=1 Tax=Methylomagnum ishizawai TaxID=1760988 RepID=A0A1Y6D683_9GAMM|nr:efflux RND transporter periplasmic adaptor subunit [Methylomagnum ishizawai]SMF95425.1 Barrel-sandwich domain of CusB or HlyD membrane-fusion [Methylomagnum ishizawai]